MGVDLASAAGSATSNDFVRVAKCIQSDIIRSPLIPYADGSRNIRLKAECLQPLGSFKIRAASSALQALDSSDLKGGVATASAGNFAQGLALACSRRGVALT